MAEHRSPTCCTLHINIPFAILNTSRREARLESTPCNEASVRVLIPVLPASYHASYAPPARLLPDKTLRDNFVTTRKVTPLVDLPAGFFHSLIVSRFDALEPQEQTVLKAATGATDA